MTLKIKDGIYHIPLELPWSSPGFVNVYLIDDTDGFIMIDCGVNGDHYFELLSKKLREINIKFSEIKLLIGTHMHSDHIGLSEKIREEGIPFALYENSIDFLNKYNDWTIRFKELKDYAITQGAPKSFVNSLSEIQTPVYAGKVSKPDVLLKEGKNKKP
jgi:glyoxylase-like metal-dependent hydrolase (beta-lactamase superfamily II)